MWKKMNFSSFLLSLLCFFCQTLQLLLPWQEGDIFQETRQECFQLHCAVAVILYMMLLLQKTLSLDGIRATSLAVKLALLISSFLFCSALHQEAYGWRVLTSWRQLEWCCGILQLFTSSGWWISHFSSPRKRIPLNWSLLITPSLPLILQIPTSSILTPQR